MIPAQSTSPAAATPSPPQDSLGCLTTHLHQDQELSGASARFYRKRTDSHAVSRVSTPASDRGFLVGIAMAGGHRRRIFHEHHMSSHDFDAGCVYIRNFTDDYQAELVGAFDFLLVEISSSFFERATDERMGRRIQGLECVTGMKDQVLANLGSALAPALARPHETSALFVDQMSTVIGTYLVEQYGGGASSLRRGTRRLSRLHEARAKDILRSQIDGDMSISDIADACNLSRSYFIRAFHETTGHTPHQWLMRQRVEMAMGLLAKSILPLAEIAVTCGFADQSHFTRVFTLHMGKPPGSWRRQTSMGVAG